MVVLIGVTVTVIMMKKVIPVIVTILSKMDNREGARYDKDVDNSDHYGADDDRESGDGCGRCQGFNDDSMVTCWNDDDCYVVVVIIKVMMIDETTMVMMTHMDTDGSHGGAVLHGTLVIFGR